MVKSSEVLLSTAKTSIIPHFADIFRLSAAAASKAGRSALRILCLFGGAAGVPAAETSTTPTTQRRNTSVTAHQRCYHNGNPTRPDLRVSPVPEPTASPRTASQPLQPGGQGWWLPVRTEQGRQTDAAVQQGAGGADAARLAGQVGGAELGRRVRHGAARLTRAPARHVLRAGRAAAVDWNRRGRTSERGT